MLSLHPPAMWSRFAFALPLFAIAACDSQGDGYAVEVLSVEEVILDERGLPGLAFDIRNTGALPIYALRAEVTLEPPFSENVDVAHETQITYPVEPGASVVIEVPLPSRASHDAYDCYRYVVAGSDGAEVPDGESSRLALHEEFDGTCR